VRRNENEEVLLLYCHVAKCDENRKRQIMKLMVTSGGDEGLRPKIAQMPEQSPG